MRQLLQEMKFQVELSAIIKWRQHDYIFFMVYHQFFLLFNKNVLYHQIKYFIKHALFNNPAKERNSVHLF